MLKLTSITSMRSTSMPFIVARVSCIASMAFGFIYFAQASAPVPLAVAHGAQAIAGIATHFPIEVFNGADATGANTTTLANGVGIGGAVQEVTLAMTNAAAAKSLWLETHGLTYQDKASVQINNSLWVSLNNTSTIVSGIGKFYGGIGGAFRHLFITFTLQPGALVDGSNTIRFRFNKTDGRSMGYRVLNLNVLDAEGNPLLADPPLPLEDPATCNRR